MHLTRFLDFLNQLKLTNKPMSSKCFFIALTLIINQNFSFANSQIKDTLNILFVGNSFTFYWNLPSLVNEMCNYSGNIVDTYQSTAGGATLKQHWVGDKNLKTMDLLKKNKYSLIILQDHSQNPILKTKESLE